MKSKILLFLGLIMLSLNTMADGMSDEQVMKYVMKETEKGTSQQEIAKELIKKGVSIQQLQRVKRKAEAMKLQQGSSSARTTSTQRTRTNPLDKDADKKIHKNSNSINDKYSSKNSGNISGKRDVDDEYEDYTLKTNERGLYYTDPNDSLEYFFEKENEETRKVFGRNIFNQENLTFQPAANMATPENYRLGGGDMVHIDIWGASQLTISETISPDGVIVVEGVGPINLGGKSIAQAKATLKAKLSQYYSDCQFDLALGETRTIQVQVIGEVQTPGTYSLNSLCSAFNALYAAGGISEIGTLRDIKVFRQGRQISTIDVYQYLMNGTTSGDVRLQDNDVIVVGPYDCLVQVQGKVKRPMWYEMKKSETVRNLLRYSGDFTGDAYTQKVRLTRKSGQEYSVYTVGEFEMSTFTLADEDVIEVDSVRPRYSNMLEVRGAVVHPGKFQLGQNIQSVRELVLACDGLREDAYVERAIMHREKEDMTLEMVSVDLKGIMAGTSPDVPLKKNDILFIPSRTEMIGERKVEITGEIYYPGTYPYADNTTLQDIILQAGGMTDAGSLAKIDVFRRVRNAKAVADNGIISESYSFSLDEQFNLLQDTTFYLKPYDQVVVRKSPAYDTQKHVFVKGEVNFTGNYVMTSEQYRLSDLIKACGGVTSLSYPGGAHLTRIMTEDEIETRNEGNRKNQVTMYENLMREGKDVNLDLADTLMTMRMDFDPRYPVAIDLEKAIAQPGSIHDLVLREGDVLEVPATTTTINITGEVMSPISMTYEKGKNLYYYIHNAGGYSSSASRTRVYGINMNGSVVKLSSNSIRDIRPGMTIVVPAKKTSKGMSTAEIMSMTSAGASLASVMVALMNILNK